MTCAIYTYDEASDQLKTIAQKTFIYTFIGMMGTIVLLLFVDLGIWIKNKIVKKKQD